jgi:hypothetical protein
MAVHNNTRKVLEGITAEQGVAKRMYPRPSEGLSEVS